MKIHSPAMETWKRTFLMNDFSVDQSLSNYTQKSDLKSLRNDLKHYCVELQAQMLEILKSETDAIVDLALHLTKLNSKILNLLMPFNHLQEDVKNIYNLIDLMQKNVTNILEKMQTNIDNQNYNHLIFQINYYMAYVEYVITNDNNDVFNNLLSMERISNNISLQSMNLELLNIETNNDSIKHIETLLLDNLSKCFLNAYKERKEEVLIRCLKMYINLGKQDRAYKTFEQNIIQPELEQFTDNYLESINYDLVKVFEDIKHILDNHINILTCITNNTDNDIKSFNFVLNSFWKAIDVRFSNIPYITAPGNPELFHQRFMATYQLLEYIAIAAGDKHLIHSDKSFQNHLKRFNLPVYFEIRFQQIAGYFESETSKISSTDIFVLVHDSQQHDDFKLKSSIILWNSIEKCMNKDIYMHQLADQFIRLVLLLLSRYFKFTEKILDDSIKLKSENYEECDNYILNALVDLKIISTRLLLNDEHPMNIENSLVFSQINKNIWLLLEKILLEAGKINNALQLKLQNHLTKSLISECNKQLIKVTSIPRLYRRTNRNLPKDASSYIVDAVKPILISYEKFKKILQGDRICEIIYDEIILNIAKEYLTLVQEVLMSVCKTEESLKKFKSRSSNYNDVSDEENKKILAVVSDEVKIREQLKLDMNYFCSKLSPLGMSGAQQALNTLMEETYK